MSNVFLLNAYLLVNFSSDGIEDNYTIFVVLVISAGHIFFSGSIYPAGTEIVDLPASIRAADLLPKIILLSIVTSAAPTDNGLADCFLPYILINSWPLVPTNSLKSVSLSFNTI
jgi:hypothetical protein